MTRETASDYVQDHQKIAATARDIERQKCINIVEGQLIQQREVNHHNPAHAAGYETWRGRVMGLEQALAALKPAPIIAEIERLERPCYLQWHRARCALAGENGGALK